MASERLKYSTLPHLLPFSPMGCQILACNSLMLQKENKVAAVQVSSQGQ